MEDTCRSRPNRGWIEGAEVVVGSDGSVLLLHDSDGALDVLPKRLVHLLRAAGSTGHASGARIMAGGGGGRGGGGGSSDAGGPNSRPHRLDAAGPTGHAEADGSRSGGFGGEDMCAARRCSRCGWSSCRGFFAGLAPAGTGLARPRRPRKGCTIIL